MSNILAIYRRELQSYFASPLAYAIAGVFWLLSGVFFVTILVDITQQVAIADSRGYASPIDVPYQFLQFFLGTLGSVALFILPILSMGLYAEERKRGTLELLATSPVTNWAVALGKLLGVLTFFTTMVLPLLIYEAIVFSTTTPPFSFTVVLVAHLGLILLAAAVLSLGMFVSSLTDSTILAAIGTFGLVLFLWVIEVFNQPSVKKEFTKVFGEKLGETVVAALGHLSLLKHYSNLTQGILDSSSLVLFASYIVLGLFLTAQSIDAFRFQRS